MAGHAEGGHAASGRGGGVEDRSKAEAVVDSSSGGAGDGGRMPAAPEKAKGSQPGVNGSKGWIGQGPAGVQKKGAGGPKRLLHKHCSNQKVGPRPEGGTSKRKGVTRYVCV